MSSARLFVAVDLPADVRRALAAWAREAVGERDELRLVAEDALHLTVAFLGSRDEADVPSVGAIVRRFAGRRCPLAVGDALWLAPRRPHVLTVAIADPDDALAALQSEVVAALAADAGFVPEDRPFRAHVTVARVRRGARVRPDALPAPPPASFRAPALTLYRSRPGPDGSRYEVLARASLAA